MKKNVVRALIILAVFLLFSCYKQSFEVHNVYTHPFITSDGKTGFSFFIYANLPDKGNSAEVVSPDGSLTWSFDLKAERIDSFRYYGSANLMMPEGVVLPSGEYSYTVISRDGRTESGTFVFDVNDFSEALKRSSGTDLPFYDDISGVTVVH